MLNLVRFSVVVLMFFAIPQVSKAAPVAIATGQTNVSLDFEALESLASLALSSVSPDVIVPGTGSFPVAFGINPRGAAPPQLATTFAYDSDDFLGTFSGAIEHTGSVFFNADSVEVGNFTIGFDGGRAAGDASGFFVESTAGIAAILFDIANPDSLLATEQTLEIAAALLVSPEFGAFLVDNNLSEGNLAGAAIGEALVQGSVIPEPTTAILLGLGLAGLAGTRRRITH